MTTLYYPRLHTLSPHTTLPIFVAVTAKYQTSRCDSIAMQEFGNALCCRDVLGYIQQPSAIMLAAATQALKLRQCTLKRFAPHGTLRLTGLHRREHARCIAIRSEEHTSELQSLMRISYAVFCLKKKNITPTAHILSRTNLQKSKHNTISQKTHTTHRKPH